MRERYYSWFGDKTKHREILTLFYNSFQSSESKDRISESSDELL